MNRADRLAEAARRIRQDVSDRALQHAAKKYMYDERWKYPEPPKSVVMDTIGYALDLDAYSSRGQAAPKQERLLRRSAYARLTLEENVRRLRLTCERIRYHYFRSVKRPFPNKAKAEAWIHEQLAKARYRNLTEEEHDERNRLLDELWHVTEALSKLDGWQYFQEPEPLYTLWGHPVGRHDPLVHLAAAAFFIERATGILADDAVALILYGKQPRSIRGTIHKQSFRHFLPSAAFFEPHWRIAGNTLFERDEIVIVLKTPDITRTEWAEELYDEVQKRWRGSKSAPEQGRITEGDRLLRDIVRDLDSEENRGPAGKRSNGFWDQVHAEWLKRGGDKTATPRSLTVRWTQLRKKLPLLDS